MTSLDIKRIAAAHFGVTVDQIDGERRTRRISWARHCAINACTEHLRDVLSDIGAAFGGRHHTSVLHAQKTVANRIAVYAIDRDQYDRFMAKVNALKPSPSPLALPVRHFVAKKVVIPVQNA